MPSIVYPFIAPLTFLCVTTYPSSTNCTRIFHLFCFGFIQIPIFRLFRFLIIYTTCFLCFFSPTFTFLHCIYYLIRTEIKFGLYDRGGKHLTYLIIARVPRVPVLFHL